MSVIVRKGDVLAADSNANAVLQTSAGDVTVAFPYPKVWEATHPRLQVPALFGAVGPLQAVAQLQQWVQNGMTPAQFPTHSGGQLLVITKALGLQRYKDTAIPYLHGAADYAIGEGAPFAYGALFALKQTRLTSVKEAEIAVRAAIHHSPDCNGSVTSLTLGASPCE